MITLLQDIKEEVIINYTDVKIIVHHTGDGWDYEDDYCHFADNKDTGRSHYTSEHNVYIDESTGLIEKCDDMLHIYLDSVSEGTYSLTGQAILVYNVCELYENEDYNPDDTGVDNWIDSSDAYTTFNSEESRLEGFKISQV